MEAAAAAAVAEAEEEVAVTDTVDMAGPTVLPPLLAVTASPLLQPLQPLQPSKHHRCCLRRCRHRPQREVQHLSTPAALP